MTGLKMEEVSTVGALGAVEDVALFHKDVPVVREEDPKPSGEGN